MSGKTKKIVRHRSDHRPLLSSILDGPLTQSCHQFWGLIKIATCHHQGTYCLLFFGKYQGIDGYLWLPSLGELKLQHHENVQKCHWKNTTLCWNHYALLYHKTLVQIEQLLAFPLKSLPRQKKDQKFKSSPITFSQSGPS